MVDSMKGLKETKFLVLWSTTLIALLELGPISEEDDNGLLTKQQGHGYFILNR